ncbi:hypothetical protein IL099_002773 [Enterococcus hirae]|nr:hypothetical protein [Enterococcus hirae]
MKKEYEVLGELKIVKKSDGTVTILLSDELVDSLPELVTFLAMGIETASNMCEMSVDEMMRIIKKNIEVDPMRFD